MQIIQNRLLPETVLHIILYQSWNSLITFQFYFLTDFLNDLRSDHLQDLLAPASNLLSLSRTML